MRPPTSHTTVRTVPYTAVPVVPHFGDVVACQPLSAQPSLTDSVRYFRFQALLRGICSGPTEISSRTSPTGSALCRVVTPAPTASADFCRSIPTPYGVGSPRQIDRSPRVRRTTFLPYTRRIYFRTFRVTIGLWISWPPRPSAAASYAVSVRRAGSLPAASFGFRLAADTLAVRLAVPVTRVRRGLSPPSHRWATTAPG